MKRDGRVPSLNAHDRVTTVLYDVLATILPGVPRAEITTDKHLKDLGADSVDRVEIIMALLDRLGVDEPMSRFSDLPDLGALVDVLVAAEGC
jgi:polyketide biosynthesis acyl carrier protein